MSAVDDALEDLLALARVPAPTFDEGERIEWLLRRLEGAPGQRDADAAGSLIWRFGDGRPRVLLLAHVDTVFARELAHEPLIEGARLRGPGVGDNAAAVRLRRAGRSSRWPARAASRGSPLRSRWARRGSATWRARGPPAPS